MKRMCLLVLPLLFQFCGKDDPGQISLSLKFNSTVTSTMKDNIKEFVFVVGKSGSSQVLLYPSECLGCNNGAATCSTAIQCIKSSGCGFAATESEFDPEINYSDIAENASMTVSACALDDNTAPIAAGTGTLKNKPGATGAITLTSNATDCINKLPPVCP